MTRPFVRAWRARGFWMGVSAVALAWSGQASLAEQEHPEAALHLYLAAVVFVILGLTRRIDAPHARSGAEGAGRTRRRALPSRTWMRELRLSGAGGRRFITAGLGLTMCWALLLTLVLSSDVESPHGFWLWCVTLTSLWATSLGAHRPVGSPSLLSGCGPDFLLPGRPRPSIRAETALVLAMLGTALCLRLWDLEHLPGVFGDEGERGVAAQDINRGHPAAVFGHGWWGVPNLYFYCVAWMLRWLGDTMVGLRMLSVVSGVMTVWFVYRIGRIVQGTRAGLLAGALLAISPLGLQFSRLAGESTPTAALWTGGFFFLLRALKAERWDDWVYCGIFYGLGLYFYPAGKLAFPLLGAYGLYALARWRRTHGRLYIGGLALTCFAFVLTFLPYGIASVKDEWQGFAGRARETSIFSPQHRRAVFEGHGMADDPGELAQPLLESLSSRPTDWARIVAGQFRATAEVLYLRGDRTAFYQHRLHGGTMLAPLWAALTLLGLIWVLVRGWQPAYGLLAIWLLIGLMGSAMTVDTPSVQRLACAWPAIILLPALLVDAILSAAHPIGPRFARRWATAPLVLLLSCFFYQSHQEYFVHYRSLCPYGTATAQARYVASLGEDYKVLQMGVGPFHVPFGYGSTRYLAPEVEGTDLSVPADVHHLMPTGGRGAAFVVYSHNAQYLPILRSLYPGGTSRVVTWCDDTPRFTAYELTEAELASARTARATYRSADGAVIQRLEPRMGIDPVEDDGNPDSVLPESLEYPVEASWHAGILAHRSAAFAFAISGAASQLEIDGNAVFDRRVSASSAHGIDRSVEVTLSRGLHDIRLSGTLVSDREELGLRWGPRGGKLEEVRPSDLYSGTTGGLSGEVWPGLEVASLEDPEFHRGEDAPIFRIDPFLGFREARDSLGRGPFVARWRGSLHIPEDGTYSFSLETRDSSVFLLDDEIVATAEGRGSSFSLELTAGEHHVEIRYGFTDGRANLEWYWTRPGLTRAIVPPEVLTPRVRSRIPGVRSSPR